MNLPKGFISVTLSNSMWRPVRCRHCAKGYVYRIAASYTGLADAGPFGIGGDSAAAGAAAGLRKKLVHGCEPFPCPDCGRYQSNMVALLCAWLWKRIFFVIVAAMIGSHLLATFGLSQRWISKHDDWYQLYVSYFWPAGFGAAVLSFVLVRFLFDPNSNAAGRAGTIPPTESGPHRVDEFVKLEADVRAAGGNIGPCWPTLASVFGPQYAAAPAAPASEADAPDPVDLTDAPRS